MTYFTLQQILNFRRLFQYCYTRDGVKLENRYLQDLFHKLFQFIYFFFFGKLEEMIRIGLLNDCD